MINNANLIFGSLNRRRKTDMIILHHAAGSGPIEAVHAYHQNIQGWSGIGYHLYVRRDGSIWRGRPLDTVGAHAGSRYNAHTIGICAEGNFETETMSEAQKQGIIEATRYALGEYPGCAIRGHREIGATACPGKNYPLNEIRTKAQQKGSEKAEAPEPETPKPMTEVPAAPKGGAFLALPVLRRGSRGEAVKSLQILLEGREHKPGRWGADGSFGGATEKTLRSFQASQGLSADGICGIYTWRKLLGV